MLVAMVGDARSWAGSLASSGRRPTPRRLAFRLAACWAVPLAALAANLVPDDASDGEPCGPAGAGPPLPVRRGAGRRRRAARGLVPEPHARRTPGSSGRRARRRSGSGRCGAWPSTGRRALTTPRAWPTGRAGSATTSASTGTTAAVRPRPTSATGTAWNAATRRCTRRREGRAGGPAGGRRTSLAPAPDDRRRDDGGPLDLLHVEGRYAVYRVEPAATVAGRRRSGGSVGLGSTASAGTG